MFQPSDLARRHSLLDCREGRTKPPVEARQERDTGCGQVLLAALDPRDIEIDRLFAKDRESSGGGSLNQPDVGGVGEQFTTAFSDGSAKTPVVDLVGRAPYCAATSPALSGIGSATQARLIPGWAAMFTACTLPMRPGPHRATFSFFTLSRPPY
ncbi:hypothetical protein [Arthrobacter sp. UYCu723]